MRLAWRVAAQFAPQVLRCRSLWCFAGAVVGLGLWGATGVGDWRTMGFTVWLGLFLPATMVAHEYAHALVYQLVTSKDDWSVVEGWTSLAVCCPTQLGDRHTVWVALAGPLAGIGLSSVALMAGQGFVGWTCLALHGANLLPVFPDGASVVRVLRSRGDAARSTS